MKGAPLLPAVYVVVKVVGVTVKGENMSPLKVLKTVAALPKSSHKVVVALSVETVEELVDKLKNEAKVIS